MKGNIMSKKIPEKNSSTVKNRSSLWIWSLAAVPVLSTALYLLILSDTIPFIKGEIFSVPGALILILAMFIWGACGFLFALFKKNMVKSLFIANAFPIICAVLYTVFALSAYFGAESLRRVAYMAATGMGLFSYVGTFVHGIKRLDSSAFEVYLDLIFIMFVFFIGYTIGKSRKLKT